MKKWAPVFRQMVKKSILFVGVGRNQDIVYCISEVIMYEIIFLPSLSRGASTILRGDTIDIEPLMR